MFSVIKIAEVDDLFAGHDATDIAFARDVEDHDGDVVLFADGKGGLIHHTQVVGDALVVGDMQVAYGVRVFARIFIVDAIHVGGFEHDVGADLVGAQRGCRIGGKEGIARAAGKHNHASLFQVADGAAADKGFGDLRHGDGAHHACGHALLFEGVLQGAMPVTNSFVADKKQPIGWAYIAKDEARYHGEIVAVVLAQEKYQAADAALLVNVDYEPLPAVVDLDKALEARSPTAHAGIPDNVAWDTTVAGGDVDAADALLTDHIAKSRRIVLDLMPPA